MLKVSAAALISFIIFLFAHFTYFHYAVPYEKTKSLLLTALCGLMIFFVLIRFLPPEDWFVAKFHLSPRSMHRWVYPAFGALFYGFLLLGYLEFYFTADRSITFRMLMIAYKQPNHVITKERMFQLYDVPGILDKRFEDLTYGGYFESTGAGYHITKKGLVILEIYRIAIDGLRLGSGERSAGDARSGGKSP